MLSSLLTLTTFISVYCTIIFVISLIIISAKIAIRIVICKFLKIQFGTILQNVFRENSKYATPPFCHFATLRYSLFSEKSGDYYVYYNK